MNDLGVALLNKIDLVMETWTKEVCRDLEIDSTKGLTYQAIYDDLPNVLQAVATLLTAAVTDQVEKLKENAIVHGAVRSEQGFDTAEVVREYRILRNVLLSVLEPDLNTGSVEEVLQAIRKIDSMLDDAISISLQSYVKHQLEILEQVQSQLLLTNRELTHLVQNQKENMSHLAHELKTPLNAIIGFSSLLLRKQQQISQGNQPSLEIKHIERVINNGQQLLQLVNNALAASRQEPDSLELMLQTAHPLKIVQTVVETLESATTAKGLKLVVDCDRAPQQVTTDTLRLQQILTNLVSNAIRYTNEGEIRIICDIVDNSHWAMAVCDTGRGISPDQQSKIFEPFFRAGRKDEYLPESNGLGLSIVKKLVHRLQGRIELTSDLGQGTTFTVIFPLSLRSNTGS